MRITILLAALLVGLVATAASAEPPDGPRGLRGGGGWDHVSNFDEDGDGVVSRDEFERNVDFFGQMDQNGDGVLTEDDFANRRVRTRDRMHSRRPGGGLVAAADADENGSVTELEWEGFLAELDDDGDGIVEELPFGQRRQGQRQGQGFDEGHRAEMRQRIAAFLDRDGDGQLEVSDLRPMFAEADDNGDGVVEGDELPSMGRGHRRHGGGG